MKQRKADMKDKVDDLVDKASDKVNDFLGGGDSTNDRVGGA